MERAEGDEPKDKRISSEEVLRLVREHFGGVPFEPKQLTVLLWGDVKDENRKKRRNDNVGRAIKRLVQQGSIEKTGFGSFYRLVPSTDASPLEGASCAFLRSRLHLSVFSTAASQLWARTRKDALHLRGIRAFAHALLFSLK